MSALISGDKFIVSEDDNGGLDILCYKVEDEKVEKLMIETISLTLDGYLFRTNTNNDRFDYTCTFYGTRWGFNIDGTVDYGYWAEITHIYCLCEMDFQKFRKMYLELYELEQKNNTNNHVYQTTTMQCEGLPF